MISLRPYQSDCLAKTLKGFWEFDRQLIVVPTGGGKTILFASLAAEFWKSQKKTLVLAHREELVDQAIDKIFKTTGLRAQKEMAENYADQSSAQVVVASIQSMQRRIVERWPADYFGLVVADEAHHAISDSWLEVLNHFNIAKVVGVTATPDRGDKKNLGSYFQNVAFEIGLFDLVHQNYLSPISIKSIPLEIDLANVTQTAGDYDANKLSDALTPYLRSIAVAIREHASFRKTLVFLPLIATSKNFVEILKNEGIAAEHIDGTSEDRKEKLAAFSAGKFDALCNAMLLTEGYDEPSIDCVVVLRPTRSRPLYSQMVGRGTRIHPTKENLLLLDFLWAHERHSLCRPAHLISKSDDEAEVITKLAEEKAKAGGESQEELELESLATEAISKRHEKLKRELEENRNKKQKTISAAEFCAAHGDFESAEYEPTMEWESQPITKPQAFALKRNKIDVSTVRGKGHASKLIGLIHQNEKLTLASGKQRALMARMGHPNANQATVSEARQFMKRLYAKAA